MGWHVEKAHLQAVVDRAAIIDVATRYAVAVDLKKWDDLGACFTDEFELFLVSTGGWVKVSREWLIDYARRTFANYDATQHISANHNISIAGDEAVCISTLNATHYVANDPDGSIHRQIGYYRYELRRQPEWKIYRMSQMLSWQEGNQDIFDRAHLDVGLADAPRVTPQS